MARLDPVAPQLPDADGHPRGPLDAAARWRYELERAQWLLRAGRPTGAAAPTDRAASQAGTTAVPEGSGAPQESSPQEPQTGPRSAPQSGSGSYKNSSNEAQPVQARTDTRASGYAIEPMQPREDGGARMPASVERALRPLKVIWPRVNVHATLQEGEAQVWVRDASIAPEERRQLAAEIAARLRAAGLRPGRLYLNGEEIFHFVKEGGGSWR